MNLRQKLQIVILAVLILFAFASYHEGSGSTIWLQWLAVVTIMIYMFIFDVSFMNESSFIFDPDAENWRRKTVRSFEWVCVMHARVVFVWKGSGMDFFLPHSRRIKFMQYFDIRHVIRSGGAIKRLIIFHHLCRHHHRNLKCVFLYFSNSPTWVISWLDCTLQEAVGR